jgi:SAM-dependent methyltransferase
MIEYSKDYHDYVFRNGKLVGEFDAMYQHSEGVPWHQDEQEDWVDIRLTVEMLKDLGQFDEIHDLGCGLGYYLSLIRDSLGSKDCQAFGYDISPTACEKARTLFPAFSFNTLDLTAVAERPAARRRAQSAVRRLFLIRGTLWYVFPRLANVVNMIRSMMAEGDQLLVVQNFPPLENSFVGKDILPNHSALIQHFASCFLAVRHIWYQDTLKSANDNWFIGLFSPRQP